MNNNGPKVIVYGPAGEGKSRHANWLKEHFGCDRVIDEWDGRDFPESTLVLTNQTPPFLVKADIVMPLCALLTV